MSGPQHLFDRNAIARKQQHIAPDDDFVTDLIFDDLETRLSAIAKPISKALLLTPFAHHGRQQLKIADQTLDLEHRTTLRAGQDNLNAATHHSDPGKSASDQFTPDQISPDYDLIISLYDIAITDDVPRFMQNIRQLLRPDGLFMAAFVGGISLNELRQSFLAADTQIIKGAVMRVAPMIDTREAGALLQKTGFALPVCDVETHTIRYADPLRLMAEIKQLGAANPLRQKPPQMLSKRHLASAIQHYAENFNDPDGRVRATLEIVWMSGWVPHESQQKPLKPGSASARLADILKDKS